MKVFDKGVLISSNLYFHTPSETAKNLYFYPVCCGHYHCDGEYLVNRTDYNSFLLLYVQSGEGYVVVDNKRQAVAAGSAFLLDCYRPHVYGTAGKWEIVWVHFDGSMARAYFDNISHAPNCRVMTPQDPHNMNRCLTKIYTMFHEKGVANEPQANKYIVSALTDFLTSHPMPSDSRGGVISETLLAYIAENFQSPLSLEDLAKKASLSPFYFSRVFKRETGYTPHEYVVMARINAAKFYLKTTALPVKEITYLCGFANESRFCTAFKGKVGVTPVSYRNNML